MISLQTRRVKRDRFGTIKNVYKKVLFSVFAIFFIAVYMLFIAVVIMFLTSALHMVNPELFQFKRFDLLTGILFIFIIVVSMRAFLKIFKKYYSLLHDIITHDRA